ASIPSANFTPRTTFGNWLWPSSRRQFFSAASANLKIMASAILFERHPLERTVRWRTVAHELSMTLVVRRCFQCSAGETWKASNASRSLVRHSTALSYLTPQLSTKASKATSASFLVSAIQISWRARLAFDCWPFGSLLRTLVVLCTQQRWPRVVGYTSSIACQKPSVDAGVILPRSAV